MSLKKKLTMAVLTTTLGATVVAAGSFALFTSNATNEGNTFTAGTVEISDGGAIFTEANLVGNMAPGDTIHGQITVNNTSDLDSWIKAEQPVVEGALFGAGGATVTIDQSIAPLPVGQDKVYDVTVTLPKAAGNEFKGATGSFSVKFDAVQQRNNVNATSDGPLSWNENAQ